MDTTPTAVTTETISFECINISVPGNSTLPPCQSESNETSNLQHIFSIIVTVVLAVLMVGIGCAIDAKKVVRHFKNPTGILVGLLCQFGIMPMLAYGWARIFAMEEPETLSLLIVGSCPGGTISNVIAYWIGGDMELSATMTTVSVIASLGMLPLLLFIYSKAFSRNSISVPFQTIGTTMALIVGPLALGSLLKFKCPKIAAKVLKICGIFGIISLIVVISISIYLFHPYWSFQTGTIIISICYPLLGMVLGYGISSIVSVASKRFRLTHRQRRTVSIETGIQNQQVATALIQRSGWSLSITGRMVVLPMLYSFSQFGWSLIYIAAFHVISYARNGKCPPLTSSSDDDEDDEDEKVDSIGTFATIADNPAFEFKE